MIAGIPVFSAGILTLSAGILSLSTRMLAPPGQRNSHFWPFSIVPERILITEIPSFCCDIALRRKSPALESLYMRRKALSREFSTRKTVGIAQNSLRSRSSAGIEGKMLSEILLTDRGSGKKWDFLRSCQSSQAILVITPELAAAPGRRSCRRPRPPAAYCARLTGSAP